MESLIQNSMQSNNLDDTQNNIESLKIRNEFSNIICDRNKNIKLQKILKYPEDLNGLSEKIECLSLRFNYSDNIIAGGFNTGHIILHDLSDINKNPIIIYDNDASINTLRWKPKSQTSSKDILLTASTDGELTYWHPLTGKIVHKIQESGSVFLSLDYSKDGSLFAIGGEDKILRIYDENMKILTSKFLSGSNYTQGHKSRINSVCFHKNDSTGNYNNILVSGGWDQRVIICDTRTNKICGTIFGPYICGDSIDLKDHLLLTGSFYPDSNIELWDLRNYKLFDPLPLSKTLLSSNVYSSQFSKNSETSYVGMGSSSSNCFRMYDVDVIDSTNNAEMSPFVYTRYMEKPCYSLDFANRKGMIAFGGGDGNIRIINIE